MRCFIGIPVVRPLADQCRMLSQGMGLATPAANLHLTLAFLGEQSASDLKDRCQHWPISMRRLHSSSIAVSRFPVIKGRLLR
jgi:2'-5' RNA ligase